MKRTIIISKYHVVRQICFVSVKTGRDLEGAACYSRRRRARRRAAAGGLFRTELMAPVMMLKRFMVVMLDGFMVGRRMLTTSMMVTMLDGFMMVTTPVRNLALAAWPMLVVVVEPIVNHKAQRPLLADAFTSDQDLVNGGAFADSLATRGLPEHMRSVLGRQIALREHEVGNVCDLLETLLQAGKLDALSNNLGRRIVDVNIAKPQVRRRVLDDKL